jgi:mannose-6-phosphate isomerase-like protein (cupin superfamily)
MGTAPLKTTYEQWLDEQQIPVVGAYGVMDVASLELGEWPRQGAMGAAIQLIGMEGLTGMYVVSIPAGRALLPERHLYDELTYVVSGRGTTEVWSGQSDDPRGEGHIFEWQAGSLFAPPLNSWHRLANGSGTEPTRLLVVTSAPIVMDLFHNLDFVFNCDYEFADRFDGRADYFKASEEREFFGSGWLWETNFIPDVLSATLDEQEAKGPGARVTWYQMSGNVLVGHMAEWPVGKYNKAHHHAGGQVLLILRSSGYTLMWPPDAGIAPYQNGRADKVVRVDWGVGSVLSPPSGWFHQHFNTGPVEARQLALRYGSKKYGVGFKDVLDRGGVLISAKKGGTQIEYQDEDPEIRRLYQEELARAGVEYRMPPPPPASPMPASTTDGI